MRGIEIKSFLPENHRMVGFFHFHSPLTNQVSGQYRLPWLEVVVRGRELWGTVRAGGASVPKALGACGSQNAKSIPHLRAKSFELGTPGKKKGGPHLRPRKTPSRPEKGEKKNVQEKTSGGRAHGRKVLGCGLNKRQTQRVGDEIYGRSLWDLRGGGQSAR